MRRVPRFAVFLALAAGVGLAFTLPAGAAVSQQSPPVAAVQVQSPGVLVSRGAAVTVPVLVVCSPGASGGLFVQLTQRVGSDIATGFGSTSVACTGNVQIVNVTVTASGKAFRKGTAVAEAELQVCNQDGCSFATDTRTITLNRP
jgi:hypothetical protein